MLKLPEKSEVWRKALAGGQFSSPQPAPEEKEEAAASSTTSLRTKPKGPPKNPALVWVTVAIVVLAVGLGVWKQFSARHEPHEISPTAPTGALESEPKTDAKADAPATAPVETEAETQAIAAAFDAIQIQGIIYSANRPVALINGHPVSPGDKIDGVTISAINASNVVLTYQGHKKTLKWQK
jgi:cytoskeletal protein RodZ